MTPVATQTIPPAPVPLAMARATQRGLDPLASPPIFEVRSSAVDEPQAHGLEMLFRAGYDGPAKPPMIGPIKAPSRRTHVLAATIGVLGAAVALIFGSAGLGMANPFGPDADSERIVVATYARPDGSVVDLRKVSCTMLAKDAVATEHLVENNPTILPIGRIKLARTVTDNIDAIADLPKGDILARALTCRGDGTWGDGSAREITMSLSVYGAESSMDSTIVRAVQKR